MKVRKVEVEPRPDACCYLEYLVDMKEGRYNRYRCNLLHDNTTFHKCMEWGWCPMVSLMKDSGKPLLTELFDIRNVGIFTKV